MTSSSFPSNNLGWTKLHPSGAHFRLRGLPQDSMLNGHVVKTIEYCGTADGYRVEPVSEESPLPSSLTIQPQYLAPLSKSEDALRVKRDSSLKKTGKAKGFLSMVCKSSMKAISLPKREAQNSLLNQARGSDMSSLDNTLHSYISTIEEEEEAKESEKLAIGERAIIHNTSFASYDGLIVRIVKYLPNKTGYYVLPLGCDARKGRAATPISFRFENVKAAPPSIFWFSVTSSDGENARVPASCQVYRTATGRRSIHIRLDAFPGLETTIPIAQTILGSDCCDWTDNVKVLAALANNPLYSITRKSKEFNFLNDDEAVIDEDRYATIFKAMVDFEILQSTEKYIEVEKLGEAFPVSKILFPFTEKQAISCNATQGGGMPVLHRTNRQMENLNAYAAPSKVQIARRASLSFLIKVGSIQPSDSQPVEIRPHKHFSRRASMGDTNKSAGFKKPDLLEPMQPSSDARKTPYAGIQKRNSRGSTTESPFKTPADMASFMAGDSFELTPTPSKHRASRRASLGDVRGNPTLEAKLSSRGRLSQSLRAPSKTVEDMESVMTDDSFEKNTRGPRVHQRASRRASVGEIRGDQGLESKLSSRGRLSQSDPSARKTVEDMESVMTDDSFEKKTRGPRVNQRASRRASVGDNIVREDPSLEAKLSSRGRLSQSLHCKTVEDMKSVMTDDSFEKKARGPRVHQRASRRASMGEVRGDQVGLESKVSSRGRLSQSDPSSHKTMEDMESVMTDDSFEKKTRGPRKHRASRRYSMGDNIVRDDPSLEAKVSSRGRLSQSLRAPSKSVEDMESVMTDDSFEKKARGPRVHQRASRRASMGDNLVQSDQGLKSKVSSRGRFSQSDPRSRKTMEDMDSVMTDDSFEKKTRGPRKHRASRRASLSDMVPVSVVG